jgi:hypothetical protein
MVPQFTKCGPQLSLKDLHLAQKATGLSFPNAFQAFLLKHNGGRPEPGFFLIRDFEGRVFDHVQLIFGFGVELQSSELIWNFEVLKDRVMSGLLPFGCTDSGDILCLQCVGVGKGRVVLWDHEKETRPPSVQNTYEVATTFEEFLSLLHDRDLTGDVAKAGAKLVKGPN